MCACVFFPSFDFDGMRLFISCAFLGYINLLVFPCVGVFLLGPSVGLTFGIDMFKYDFIIKYFVFPSTVIQSFAGYCGLCWHLWSLGVYKTSMQGLLAIRVSID